MAALTALNSACTVPVKVTTSAPSMPFNTGVPLKDAIAVESNTLLSAVNPETVNALGATELLTVAISTETALELLKITLPLNGEFTGLAFAIKRI